MAEAKKISVLWILEILQTHSDYNHRLKQKEIIEYLQRDYGIKLERKAVGRTIEELQEAGYDIISTNNGTYMNSHEFEDAELRMLIDGVLSSRHISARHSKDIIKRLCGMSNEFFESHVKHIHAIDDWNKTDNQMLFYNIELIDDAIEKKVQIRFDYNKYGSDKKLHKSSDQLVTPYQMILQNQRYYLMAHSTRWNNMAYYRLDHITNMSVTKDKGFPLKKIPGYENGINYKNFSSALPYLFADDLENIVFEADAYIVDQVVDWFGNHALIKKNKGSDKVTVSVEGSPNAIYHWALQYVDAIEIKAPKSLRDRIKEGLENGAEKYK